MKRLGLVRGDGKENINFLLSLDIHAYKQPFPSAVSEERKFPLTDFDNRIPCRIAGYRQ